MGGCGFGQHGLRKACSGSGNCGERARTKRSSCPACRTSQSAAVLTSCSNREMCSQAANPPIHDMSAATSEEICSSQRGTLSELDWNSRGRGEPRRTRQERGNKRYTCSGELPSKMIGYATLLHSSRGTHVASSSPSPQRFHKHKL